MGLASYYRQFIKNFASIASPLHKLTEKPKTNFQWTSQYQEAFDCLKTHLISLPVLAKPDWSPPFLLDTDATDTGIGGCNVVIISVIRVFIVVFKNKNHMTIILRWQRDRMHDNLGASAS